MSGNVHFMTPEPKKVVLESCHARSEYEMCMDQYRARKCTNGL